MVKKQKKTNRPKVRKKTSYLTWLVSGLVIILLIKTFVGCSLQDMENGAFRSEENARLDDAPVTLSAKQAVPFYWDAEDIIAQQVDRAISYRTSGNIQQTLRNVAENVEYNRNKAAVYFYLAYAYEAIGLTSNAAEVYEKLRNKYENRAINLYLFNAPREAAGLRSYYVSLYEETLLRQARLSQDYNVLKQAATSRNYGLYDAPSFVYADLVQDIVKSRNWDLTSSRQYLRLISAQKVANVTLAEKPTADIGLESPELAPLAAIRQATGYRYIYGVKDSAWRIIVRDDGRYLVESMTKGRK